MHLHDWVLERKEPDPEAADLFFVPGYGICMFEGGFLKIPEVPAGKCRCVEEPSGG